MEVYPDVSADVGTPRQETTLRWVHADRGRANDFAEAFAIDLEKLGLDSTVMSRPSADRARFDQNGRVIRVR